MEVFRPAILALLWFAAACASLETQSVFSTGRRALLSGEPDNALAYFERVASSDPKFVVGWLQPRRSIWTYIGRAQYNSGKYNEARSAFEKALSHLSDDYIARLYLGLTLLRPANVQAPGNPFNLQEVTFAVREGVEAKRVAALARERGVVFDLTNETESQLRKAGADDFLIGELKSIRARSTKQGSPSESQRNQGSKELTTALNGLREWLEYTRAYTTQGRFWDPGQEIRNQIQLTLKQIAARPPDWDRIISNAEGVGSKMEEESERARRDEEAELRRQQQGR